MALAIVAFHLSVSILLGSKKVNRLTNAQGPSTMAPSALAIRRITIDMKNVMTLADSGLFWIQDEADLTHGWAIVCGPTDTPYYGGAFCFDVKFPDNYPFEPPHFTYLTNDGRTRFNPNLYKNGKVCLSLLNTWQGEQWSGIQSLSSILQSIQTAVLTEEPLRNEPAYASMSSHADMPPYNRMVFHSVLETAILEQLSKPPAYMVPFYEAAKAWFLKAKDAVIAKARALAAEWDGKTESMGFFTMATKYKFGELADRVAAISA